MCRVNAIAIQLWNGSTGDYQHSIIITNNGSSYDTIMCASHNEDSKNVSLLGWTKGFGGETSCYARKLSFYSSNFAS